MKKIILIFVLLMSILNINISAKEEEVNIIPINHATFVIKTKEITIFVDPVGDKSLFKDFDFPDIILVTHTHRDHLDAELLKHFTQDKTSVIVSQSVFEETKMGWVFKNGDNKSVKNINIEAVPMYNLTKERLNYHKKGDGNGYVITIKNKRIYIAGDTEDIQEMRNLKNIDYALVCMNLPFTMTEEQAASAVLEMKPKVVIPYHYRGKGGLSDLNKFKQLVSDNKEIEVRLLKWY